MIAFNSEEDLIIAEDLLKDIEEFLKVNPGCEERFEIAVNNNPEAYKLATEGKGLPSLVAAKLLARLANCKSIEESHKLATTYPDILFWGNEKNGIRPIYGLGEKHGK